MMRGLDLFNEIYVKFFLNTQNTARFFVVQSVKMSMPNPPYWNIIESFVHKKGGSYNFSESKTETEKKEAFHK